MPTEKLKVELTDEERGERARTTADLIGRYTTKETEAKESAAENRAALKKLREEMEEAGRASREGWEYQEVEVFERPDWRELTVDVFRKDTGELVRTRPMSPEEIGSRQQSLLS